MKKELLAAGTLALFATSATLAGLPNYVVVPLGDAPGGDFFSRAFDINDHGEIVGSSKTTFDDIQQVAVRWTPGSNEPEILSGLDGFDFSRAQTINNDGLIGGFEDVLGENQHAWIWDEHNGLDFFLGDIGDPDISFSRMGEVTNHGKIVGWLRFSDPDSGTRGYVFDLDTEDRLILDPIGPDGNQSLASSMNPFGLVVGSASEFPDREKPFRDAAGWSPGQTTPNVLPGMFNFDDYEETAARHATEAGVIVGSAGNRDLDGTLFAQSENWIWEPGTQTAESLGFLDDMDWTKVSDINDDATFMVGWAYNDGENNPEFIENHVGAIWTPHEGWVDVNTLILDGSDYRIVELAGMNAAGEIVGTAINPDGDVEAVLLTPGCLTLDVDNLVSGENAQIRVGGGTPGSRTVVLAGFGGEPSTFIGVKGWCATFGFDVRLKKSKIRLTATGVFNGDGVFEATTFVRDQVQGLHLLFQAAEHDTCPDECMSNIVEAVVQ